MRRRCLVLCLSACAFESAAPVEEASGTEDGGADGGTSTSDSTSGVETGDGDGDGDSTTASTGDGDGDGACPPEGIRPAPPWGVAENLGANPDFGMGASLDPSPRLSLADDGDGIAAWTRHAAPGTDEVWGSIRDAETGEWSDALRLDFAPASNASLVGVGSGAAGTGFAVWSEGGTLVARRYNSGSGAWEMATAIAGPGAGGSEAVEASAVSVGQNAEGFAVFRTASAVQAVRATGSMGIWGVVDTLEAASGGPIRVSADPTGGAIAVWVHDGSLRASRYDATPNAWTPAIAVENGASDAAAPSVATDAQGNAIAAWHESDGSARAARFDVGTNTWSTPVVIGASGASDPAHSTDVGVRDDGVAVAVFRRGAEGYVTVFDPLAGPAGTWSPDMAVTGAGALGSPGIRVALDEVGGAVALWRTVGEDSPLSSRLDLVSGAWDDVVAVETNGAGDGSWIDLAVAGNGTAAAAWDSEPCDELRPIRVNVRLP